MDRRQGDRQIRALELALDRLRRDCDRGYERSMEAIKELERAWREDQQIRVSRAVTIAVSGGVPILVFALGVLFRAVG